MPVIGLGFLLTYTHRDHKLVRAHFRGRGMAKIARRLDNLRQWRNNCDYNDVVSGVSSLLTSAIAQAHEVLDNLP